LHSNDIFGMILFMTIWCSQCEKWSEIPVELAGIDGAMPCEHCGAMLQVEGRYALCPDCGRYHRTGYEVCPFLIEGVEVSAVTVFRGAMDGYSVEAQKRRTRKRGDEYYWQLYIDYRDRLAEPEPAAEASVDVEASGMAAEPPHPADIPEYEIETTALVGMNDNGNGHGRGTSASRNGVYANNGNGNGYSNGNGNGNGHGYSNGKGSSQRVDLALTESVPVMLFPEIESEAASSIEEVAPTTVAAGNYNEFDYELISDPSRLAQVAEMLAQEKIMGIDTETTGLDPYTCQLLLLQISTLDKVYIIDCKRVVPLALKAILENPGVLKVAQNAKFEYEMLKQQVGITLAGMFDTMLAERLLMAGIGREISLKAIAQKYIGATLDKSVRESFYKLAQNGDAYLATEQLHYAARDAFIMIPIYRAQQAELKKHRLLQVAELEFRCIAAVGDMELAGVQIDVERWRKIIADVAVQRDKAQGELSELLAPASRQATMFGVPSINLNSNVQLTEAFATLGVMLPDTMEATLVRYDHPAVAKLLEYRGHEKTLSAFGENVLSLINPKTGRIHPDFNQYGADTGRFSCTKPNIQQIPATSDFRRCFVPAEGYKLVTSDYSQAELRILAELSQDVAFVEAFRSGQDLHTLTASQMFGVPVDQVQKPQRSAAKAINFGLAYGMGPGGLAPRLGVSLDEAKELISRYFKAYPGIQRWLDKAAKDAVRLGYSATPLGRKRFYNMPDESLKRFNEDDWRKQISAIERQGKNTPIQGCIHGDTRILVKSFGYVPIREVCGQEVEVWDGHRYVKAMVATSGKKRLVRMRLRGGYHIECSPDHKFWVACNNGYKWVWKWKTPGEIRAQNRVALNSCPVEWSYPLHIAPAVPGTAHNASQACLSTLDDTRSLGEWLGRVASDGSLGHNNTVSLVVAEHEEAILGALKSTTEHWGHVHHSIRVTETQPGRLHKLTLAGKGLHDQLVAFGVKERVPDFAWRDSNLLAAYLRGLFDGDGTVHPDGALLTFGQGEKHLSWAREVQEALLLLGVRSRINVYTNRNYRINLRILKRDMPLFCERIGFMNPTKQQKALQITSIRFERISPQYGIANLVESIEFTDQYVDMYDVVNSETGQFMANGMIVHNSNADMTKLALINIRAALQGWDARTVNTVHDEIVVEVREDQAEEVKKIVAREMVAAGEAILKEVPVVADASVADYWSK
jgi:DNA polymerase-1